MFLVPLVFEKLKDIANMRYHHFDKSKITAALTGKGHKTMIALLKE